MSYESKIDVIRQYFRKKSIVMKEKSVDEVYIFYGSYDCMGAKDYSLLLRLIIEDKDSWLRMIVSFPLFPMKDDVLMKVSELLTRVNFRLNFGRFEMNYDNGQVRFTSCQESCVLECSNAYEVLDRQFVNAIAISNRFFPYLRRVICNDESPLDVGTQFRNG